MDAQTTVTKTKKKSTKLLTLSQAEEQHLSDVSTTTTTKKLSEAKVNIKMSKMKSDDQTNLSHTKENATDVTNTSTNKTQLKKIISSVSKEQEDKMSAIKEEHQEERSLKSNSEDCLKKDKKKTKSKKNKKGESDKQNISVKSSFSKFDALQKRNLINNPQGEIQKNCRLCDKPVYKMEEIKAEMSIYHRNCFRCNECNKQLKVDTYQSHEGVLYCTIHFKSLFAPKLVEDDDSVKPRKPELIIRENQPTELPPDVVRASDKPNLGLEELQQLNVRSRFQVFEQGNGNESEEIQQQKLHTNGTGNSVVKRSASILSKVAKLQQLGSSVISQDTTDTSDNDDENRDSNDNDDDDVDSASDNFNAELKRQRRQLQKRERPVGLGEAMNDIRTLFEKGHGITKEERREERKQEIQNIRSRLFMGKQARIKEMYQQAVAESEHAITAADKKSDISIEVDSRSLRERFENGEVFRENQSSIDEEGENSKRGAIEKEADVFESAISKKSRSIFMELDANVISNKNQNTLPHQPTNRQILQHQKSITTISSAEGDQYKNMENGVIKCGEAIEDVKIETSEISEKFKFFETYKPPAENHRRVFRITPPRDGVVKMPSPEEQANGDDSNDISPDRHIIAHSRTTSLMLNKFRELEKNPQKKSDDSPKPLKCFTPPPDGNRRIYAEQESDEYETNEDDDDESESEIDASDDDYYNGSHTLKDDESLREAQNAARAKQLRVKFEKWQANEINHENNDDRINVYSNNVSDENSIESTKSIRERFEKMKNAEETLQSTRPRHQVNRFV